MRPLAACFVAALLLTAPSSAQDEASLTAREAELVASAVPGLHGIADALQAEKQHLRALELRREIWMDYDENDARARDLTGFVQVGSQWRKDAVKLVLDRDLTVKSSSKLRKIDRDLAKLEKGLLAGHRELATAWTKLGKPDRATRHWRRVLRFAPGDRAAAEALALAEFEGFAGTELELRMLRRGRAIHGAVDWLNRTEFPVRDLGEQRLPLLTAANITHTGVQSEFFTVWGALPKDQLATVAQECERSLLLAHALFGDSTGEPFRPQRIRNLVFVADQAQYAATLEVCRAQFDEGRFVFLRDSVDQCFLDHDGESLRVHKGGLGLEVMRDQAVRGVMQDAVGIVTEGLWEGLGHAACGFLFGRTLTFLLEQQTQKTVASWTQRTLAPDLEVWMQIAQESAWAKSDTRSSELVLISAARFTTEQRVKAWAICHYLFHWRPELILELDQSRTEKIRTPPDVEAEFLRRTGYQLPRIDDEWRTFWSRSDELRKAMTRDPLPDEKQKTRKAIERSRGVVDAVNAARAAARVGPLGFYVEHNPGFAAVRHYEQELGKAEHEQEKRDKQKASGRKPEPVVMPTPPAAIGGTVLWSRSEQPVEAVDQWLRQPAWRDVLLHPGRDLLAVPDDLGGCLVGVALPAQLATRGLPLAWPRHGQSGVLASARVGELGGRAAAALAAAGKGPDDVVGVPLTLHFLRAVGPDVLAQVQCTVCAGNRRADGVLIRYEVPGGADDLVDTAVGCIAYVPLSPFAAGEVVEVRWQLPASMLAKDEQFAVISFTVR